MPSSNNPVWITIKNNKAALNAACDGTGCNYNNDGTYPPGGKDSCKLKNYDTPVYQDGTKIKYLLNTDGGPWARNWRCQYNGGCSGSGANSCKNSCADYIPVSDCPNSDKAGSGQKYHSWTLDSGETSSEYFNNISEPYLNRNSEGTATGYLDLPEDIDKNVLKNMAQCCAGTKSGDPSPCGDLYNVNNDPNPGCTGFCLENEVTKNCLKQIMPEYCKGDNLNTKECKDWCRVDPVGRCNEQLSAFCKDKEGDETYESICGCFYDSSYYTNLYNEVVAMGIPSSQVDGRRDCISSLCAAATLRPYADDLDSNNCQVGENQICVQNMTIDSSTINTQYLDMSSTCDQTISNDSDDSDDNGDNDKAIAIVGLLILFIIGYMLVKKN
jgi:hypothetical protein